MHGWPSSQRRGKWVSMRIVYSFPTNCSEMPVSGSYWVGDLTFYGLWTNLLVRSQNGQKLATNAWRVWSRTFCAQVSTDNIVMWETNTTMQTGTVSRLWFCKRSRRVKMNIRRSSLHFRESHVCANKLDVQETNFSFHTALQKRK